MSDEIREAFDDSLYAKMAISIPQKVKGYAIFEEGYKAGATSRDAEISELVEALRTAYFVGTDPDIISKIDFKDLVCRYTKTPCPECGGYGEKYVDANGDVVSTKDAEYKLPCPDCKGSGKVWRRK